MPEKILRYNGNLVAFASNALATERTIFGVDSQSDALTPNINSSFLRGWAAGVNPDGYPTEQWFNAVGFVATQLSAYIHQFGVPEYDVAQAYYVGSICNYQGNLYTSISDSNIGHFPTDGVPNWRPLFQKSFQWNSSQTYINNDVTTDSGVIYVSINASENVNKQPSLNPTYWKPAFAPEIGEIKAFGFSPPPAGWIPFGAAPLSRATYAQLFSKFGTTWGAGDGSTTFGVPPARIALVAAGGTATAVLGNTVGSLGGEENHLPTIAETAAHQHISPAQLDENMSPRGAYGTAPSTSQSYKNTSGDSNTYGLGYTSDTGQTQAFNVMQPSGVVLWCVYSGVLS